MNPATRPAAALLLAAILSIFSGCTLAWPWHGVLAQGPLGAGSGERQDPASTPAPAAAGTPTKPRNGEIASATPQPTLADFSWLIGSWQGAWGPRFAQQVWTAPRAGMMLGTFQVAENNKTLVIELFTITETPTGIELRLRHFTPSLAPWEKDGATVLRLASVDAGSAVFENALNGEPKTQSFRHVDGDIYVLRSEVIPREGDPVVAEITFHRARPEPAAGKHKAAKKPQ